MQVFFPWKSHTRLTCNRLLNSREYLREIDCRWRATVHARTGLSWALSATAEVLLLQPEASVRFRTGGGEGGGGGGAEVRCTLPSRFAAEELAGLLQRHSCGGAAWTAAAVAVAATAAATAAAAAGRGRHQAAVARNAFLERFLAHPPLLVARVYSRQPNKSGSRWGLPAKSARDFLTHSNRNLLLAAEPAKSHTGETSPRSRPI